MSIETFSIFLIAAWVVVGAAVGSFIGCAVYRLPRKLSLVSPPSSCPACGHVLTKRELIPIFSFLFQRGRARCCDARLSPVYFWVELACAALAGIIAYALIY